MYAMQYEINLPADYDMGIVRDRVARRGSALDGFAGLRFKAYLIRERVRGEATNAYAPFYVWDDIDGMRRFLWGGAGFAGIVSSFGRPCVQDWTVAAVLDGPAQDKTPTWATKTITGLPEAAVPDEAVTQAVANLEGSLTASTHTAVLAVDVTTWRICEFRLHEARPTKVDGAVYEVLHCSTGSASPAPRGAGQAG
jgi:hypothetical protein